MRNSTILAHTGHRSVHVTMVTFCFWCSVMKPVEMFTDAGKVLDKNKLNLSTGKALVEMRYVGFKPILTV